MSSSHLNGSSSSKDCSPEWVVLHFNEFCPEDEDTCSHDLLVEGLEDAFQHLDTTCKPFNSWRPKQRYGAWRKEYHCLICQFEIAHIDRAVGVFNKLTAKWTAKIKAFVMHDTCLSLIAQDKRKGIRALKDMLADFETKRNIEKFSIFESKHTCIECGIGRKNEGKLVTKQDSKIINCSDLFCNYSFHWKCARKSGQCNIDYNNRLLYCKREHNGVLTKPNNFSQRGDVFSQAPSEFDMCLECARPVCRWPVAGKVLYLRSCCETFVHQRCAINRLEKGNMWCGNCGSWNRYFASLQEQGLRLLKYRKEMEKNEIPMRRASFCEKEEEKKEEGDETLMETEIESKEEGEDGKNERDADIVVMLNNVKRVCLMKDGDKENGGVSTPKKGKLDG